MPAVYMFTDLHWRNRKVTSGLDSKIKILKNPKNEGLNSPMQMRSPLLKPLRDHHRIQFWPMAMRMKYNETRQHSIPSYHIRKFSHHGHREQKNGRHFSVSRRLGSHQALARVCEGVISPSRQRRVTVACAPICVFR